jgi:hypothetical protein
MYDIEHVAIKQALQLGNVVRVKHRAFRILAIIDDYNQLKEGTTNQRYFVQHISEHDVTFVYTLAAIKCMLGKGATVLDSDGTQIFPQLNDTEKS